MILNQLKRINDTDIQSIFK